MARKITWKQLILSAVYTNRFLVCCRKKTKQL